MKEDVPLMDQPEEGARVVQRDAEHAVFPHALFVHRAAEHLVHHLQHKKTRLMTSVERRVAVAMNMFTHVHTHTHTPASRNKCPTRASPW